MCGIQHDEPYCSEHAVALEAGQCRIITCEHAFMQSPNFQKFHVEPYILRVMQYLQQRLSSN